MNIVIEVISYRRQNGKWVPKANMLVSDGAQTRVVPYIWLNQECDNRDGADLCARFGAKQMLIRNGYSKKDFDDQN